MTQPDSAKLRRVIAHLEGIERGIVDSLNSENMGHQCRNVLEIVRRHINNAIREGK